MLTTGFFPRVGHLTLVVAVEMSPPMIVHFGVDACVPELPDGPSGVTALPNVPLQPSSLSSIVPLPYLWYCFRKSSRFKLDIGHLTLVIAVDYSPLMKVHFEIDAGVLEIADGRLNKHPWQEMAHFVFPTGFLLKLAPRFFL